MSFNVVEKCTVMHIGTNNRKSNNFIAEQHLNEVDQLQDFGVLITNDLQWRSKVDASYKKLNKSHGFISHNFY